MIPKIVHYCWFGGNRKPAKVQKCINSWYKYLPEYTFMEWSEANFDIHCSMYVEQAYENKKYAFVSDVARIQALKRFGGIYLDTDVEVFKSFDPILNKRCVFGFEYGNWVATSFMACEPGHSALQMFESQYVGEEFVDQDGTLNMTTNVERLTSLLKERGLSRNNQKQELEDGILVYPIEFFSPYDYVNCILERTEKSYCAHLFLVTWLPANVRFKKGVKKVFVKLFGKDRLIKLRDRIGERK